MDWTYVCCTVVHCAQHAGELRQHIRQGFEAQRSEADPYVKKFLLSDARAQLKYLRETLLLRN